MCFFFEFSTTQLRCMFNNVRCLCDTRTSCDECVYEFWRLSNKCVVIVLRVGKMKTTLYNCILKTEYEIVRLTHDIPAYCYEFYEYIFGVLINIFIILQI